MITAIDDHVSGKLKLGIVHSGRKKKKTGFIVQNAARGFPHLNQSPFPFTIIARIVHETTKKMRLLSRISEVVIHLKNGRREKRWHFKLKVVNFFLCVIISLYWYKKSHDFNDVDIWSFTFLPCANCSFSVITSKNLLRMKLSIDERSVFWLTAQKWLGIFSIDIDLIFFTYRN